MAGNRRTHFLHEFRFEPIIGIVYVLRDQCGKLVKRGDRDGVLALFEVHQSSKFVISKRDKNRLTANSRAEESGKRLAGEATSVKG
jgi:hypothetical protein